MTIYNRDDFIAHIHNIFDDAEIIKTNKKICYFNIPCAFDIETTSFYDGDEKRGIMYEWTLALHTYVVYGRTWDEFIEAMNTLALELKLYDDLRLIIYVHNLAFEFQFIRKRFEWNNVFAVDVRKPVYARTTSGIEFRCSYILSGYSLAGLGSHLKNHKINKMVGDLDYSLKRHSYTPLTDTELGYCEADVQVVVAYITECIETEGDITKIPMTNTGYVRRYCRAECLYSDKSHRQNYKYHKYRALMNVLSIDLDEYHQLKRAFQGGFTHANAWYTDEILYDVNSIDFTSSYPSVMICEKFPMSKGERIKIDSIAQFERNIQLYCCLFDIEFNNIESTALYEHPLSHSRCFEITEYTLDNGRVVEAKHLKTTLTEQDYFILKRFYKWSSIKVSNLIRYQKEYLPTDFVKAIVKLYQDKTELKGVAGREDDYMRAKAMLNSTYGMCVTDICRPEIKYTDDWTCDECDELKIIEKNNKSVNRFLFFPWGVWVTAYARRNLFTGISEFGNDYIYADTDSIKCKNINNHMDYIIKYNARVCDKISNALKFHKIPVEYGAPKTIKNVSKPIGVWDDDGQYTRFKTLGAKRYMAEHDGDISLTVSGLNKKITMPFLKKQYNDPFNAFTDDMYIPSDYTGKLTHTYIDDDTVGYITDYTGCTASYSERSSIHLEASDYTLSLSQQYIDYLMGIKDFEK